MILTESMTGGLSCWMKENPRQGSGSTAYEVTMAGWTVREREKKSKQLNCKGERGQIKFFFTEISVCEGLTKESKVVYGSFKLADAQTAHQRPLTRVPDYEVPTGAV